MKRLILILMLSLLGAGQARAIEVLAANTMIADIARRIAGEQAVVGSLLPYGADPHAFQPVPRDMKRIETADLVLVNGLGLEGALQPFLDRAPSGRVAVVSRALQPRALAGEACPHGHDHGHEHDCGAGEYDPHVWFVPMNVASWGEVIAEELSRRDPTHVALYRQRSTDLRAAMAALDRWAAAMVAAVPAAERKIVSDHAAFGYFADRYGFEIVGSVLPGFSTAAETSAKDLARLMTEMRKAGVRRLFVEPTAKVSLASRVASDLGIEAIALPACALEAPGGAVSTYEDYFRALVRAVTGRAEP